VIDAVEGANAPELASKVAKHSNAVSSGKLKYWIIIHILCSANKKKDSIRRKIKNTRFTSSSDAFYERNTFCASMWI
jgi:hypothetical protein